MGEALLPRGNCLLRIKQMYNTMKTAERTLADFILSSPERVIAETMESLAANSGVSYATVSRFCRKIGYTGFRQLKDSLMYDVINSNEVSAIIQKLSFGGENTIEGICENAYKLAFKVLDDSYSIMDTNVIKAVVREMIQAKRICFIGAGYSAICARYAYSRFFRIGLNCLHDLDSTLYRMQVSLLGEGDMLFAISSSGRTENVVEAARLAKKNRALVVSLSDFAISPLSKTSDYNLYTTSRNASMFLDIDMPLITGQITIIDMLFMCCTIALEEAASISYEKTISSAMTEKMHDNTK